MKTVLVAKVVVRDSLGRILLLTRSNTDKRRPGDLDLPGGGVDPGEGYAQAAAREVLEEAGISVDPDELTLLYTGTEFYKPETSNVSRFLYGIRLQGDTPAVQLSFEHSDYAWVEIDELLHEFSHPFYSVGIRYARDHAILP